MKAEAALWRLAAALLGGGWMVAISAAAIAFGYAATLYVWFHPLRRVKGDEPLIEIFAAVAIIVFLLLAIAPAALRSAWRERTLLRLAPNAKRLKSALTRRLVLVVLIAMVPAVMLRALLSLKLGTSVDATIAFADVTVKTYGVAVLYLASVAVPLAITCGLLKVPLRSALFFLMYPPMYGALFGYWWMSWASCATVLFVQWGQQTFKVQMAANEFRARRAAAKGRARPPWWIARLQQRAASAAAGPEGASLRIAALLAGEPRTLRMILLGAFIVIYMALSAGFMNRFAVSWLLAFPIAILLAQMNPLSLGRIMLLPLGVERARIGHIMTAVWVRGLTSRMLIYSVLGIASHALLWWLNWPAFIRSPFFSSADVTTQLLWSPLAQSVGLYGVALSVCLLCSASPRLLAAPSFLRVGPVATVVLVAIVGIAIKWAINELIPATATRNMGHIAFAVVSGLMLPVGAWCVHRALKYQWRRAPLSAIAVAMQTWSQRQQKG